MGRWEPSKSVRGTPRDPPSGPRPLRRKVAGKTVESDAERSTSGAETTFQSSNTRGSDLGSGRRLLSPRESRTRTTATVPSDTFAVSAPPAATTDGRPADDWRLRLCNLIWRSLDEQKEHSSIRTIECEMHGRVVLRFAYASDRTSGLTCRTNDEGSRPAERTEC